MGANGAWVIEPFGPVCVNDQHHLIVGLLFLLLTLEALHGNEPAIHSIWENFMSKEQRGTKRLCESCEKKFYDLGKTPIVCPICETPFVEEKPKPKPKPRPRPRPRPKAADAPAKEEEQAAEKEAVAEQAPSSKGKAPSTEPASESDPEFVSLEEAAAEEDVDEDAKLADLGDDEVEIPPDENNDVFLEDDEDASGSVVSDIVVGVGDTKDET